MFKHCDTESYLEAVNTETRCWATSLFLVFLSLEQEKGTAGSAVGEHRQRLGMRRRSQRPTSAPAFAMPWDSRGWMSADPGHRPGPRRGDTIHNRRCDLGVKPHLRIHTQRITVPKGRAGDPCLMQGLAHTWALPQRKAKGQRQQAR